MRISRSTTHPGFGRSNCGGVALIIVLAFVVLLTGLIIAFFSRSIVDRQISNSSVNRAKISAFANGATDAIIGELKQEIVLSSSAIALVSGTIYLPLSPASMLPQFSGTSGITATGSAAPNNLLKLSGAGQLFYSGSNGSIPASGVSNVIAVSSTVPSLNGRYVTPARWNEHFLLPITSSTDSTPAAGSFISPSWILVARDGSNPTIWKSSMIASGTSTSSVIGRYAFAIYHEGGLLDVNAAGYPSTTSPSQSSYKPGLSYADLTQLPGGFTSSQIDKLVAWRNFASIPVPGSSFVSPAFTTASGSNFYNVVISSTTGYLSVSGSAANNSQTDRMFGSRQELIAFVQNALGFSGTSLNVLNYLTTFSRDLNQPSFSPSPSRPLSTASGVLGGGNDKPGGDNVINPAFPSLTVTGTFTRNDGTAAIVGEPLVKKRFALSRLAWVSAFGPLANDNGVLNPGNNPAIATVINTLEQQFGYSAAFLQLGGPTNIYKYFGLIWLQDNRPGIGDSQYKWAYNHKSVAYPASLSVATTSGNPIESPASSALGATAPTYPVAGREMDFFELLKAAIPEGALGKTFQAESGGPANTTPYGYQQSLDGAVDAQIIQIGANIINQAAIDSYSRRILFSDGAFLGGKWHEFHGVVDLPYLYRVREGKIMTKNSNPPESLLPSTTGSTGTLISSGAGVVVQEPEIWNPHAFLSVTATNPRPTNFQLTAISTDPESAPSTATNIQPEGYWRFQVKGGQYTDPNPIAGAPVNVALTFSIPTTRLDLFREPTLLLKAGVPSGSALAGPSFTGIFTASQYTNNAVTDNKSYIGISLGTLNMAWQGSIPAGGIDGTNPVSATNGAIPCGYVSYLTVAPGITYRLQYLDPSGNWETYDEKFAMIANAGNYDTPCPNGSSIPHDYNKTFSANVEQGETTSCDHIIGSEMSVVATDPRTSRFGMLFAGSNGRGAEGFSMPLGASFGMFSNPTGHGAQFNLGWAAPPGSGVGSAAIQSAAQQDAVATARPDENRGFYLSAYDAPGSPYGINQAPATKNAAPENWSTATLNGWYPANQLAITSAENAPSYGTPAELQPGLITQNNPATGITTGTFRFVNDANGPGPLSGSYTNPVSWAAPQTGTYDYSKQFFADPDGVVRRGMAAFVPVDTKKSVPALVPAANQPSGQPMKLTMNYSSTPAAPWTSGSDGYEYYSRPIILNRPFRSVAELGYVFSGTPWRNLDMNTPESMAASLLDVFCVSDSQNGNALVAGKVNLNTRQQPVLQAILSGAYMDEFSAGASTMAPPETSALASSAASVLLNRTMNTVAASDLGPLANVSELIGKWYQPVAVLSSTDGSKSYVGFSSDQVTSGYDLTSVLDPTGIGTTDQRISRFREASVRALANAGQTRVWNLLIDLVAQTGRFPAASAAASTPLAAFNVEGEQHYWVHVAIDRFTGQVIDKQVEIVKQ